MDSLPEEREKPECCAACGAWWKKRFLFSLPDITEIFLADRESLRAARARRQRFPLCYECLKKHNHRESKTWHFSGSYMPEAKQPPPGPPGERFRELLSAARVLLSEDIRDEDQIIPTLLAAKRASDQESYWAQAKEKVVRRNLERLPDRRIDNLRVVGVVDGTLILEWEPVVAKLVSSSLTAKSGEFLTYRWQNRTRLRERGDQPPYRDGIFIRILPYKRRIQSKEVTSHYQQVLEIEGRQYGNPRDAVMEYEFTGTYLELVVAAGVRYSQRFPAPLLVESFYKGLAQQFKTRLAGRQAGPGMEPTNLVPACVAFFLRACGGLSSPKEIEQLLNEHLFGGAEKYLSGSSASPNAQLWRDVKVAHRQIMRVLDEM
jgi:hypothetical protein